MPQSVEQALNHWIANELKDSHGMWKSFAVRALIERMKKNSPLRNGAWTAGDTEEEYWILAKTVCVMFDQQGNFTFLGSFFDLLRKDLRNCNSLGMFFRRLRECDVLVEHGDFREKLYDFVWKSFETEDLKKFSAHYGPILPPSS